MVRPKALKETKLNGIVLVFLLIAIFGIAWGEFNQVESGILYFSLAFAGIGVISLIREFKNETDKKELKTLFKTPFLQSTLLASAMYLAGFFFIVVVNLIFRVFSQSFSTVQFFSPLYMSAGGLGSGISQSYNAGVIENSPFFQWFYGVWTAGTIEEFVFGYALYLAFWVISQVIITEIIFGGKAPFGIPNQVFNETFTFICVIGAFAGIHVLNNSYNTPLMFISAMVFRLLMSLSLFKWGLGIAFTMGIHHSNNNVAFIVQNGFGALIEVLFTNPFGLVFVALFLILIIYVFRNIDKVIKLFKVEVLNH